jgi:hypothetical protein
LSVVSVVNEYDWTLVNPDFHIRYNIIENLLRLIRDF